MSLLCLFFFFFLGSPKAKRDVWSWFCFLFFLFFFHLMHLGTHLGVTIRQNYRTTEAGNFFGRHAWPELLMLKFLSRKNLVVQKHLTDLTLLRIADIVNTIMWVATQRKGKLLEIADYWNKSQHSQLYANDYCMCFLYYDIYGCQEYLEFLSLYGDLRMILMWLNVVHD